MEPAPEAHASDAPAVGEMGPAPGDHAWTDFSLAGGVLPAVTRVLLLLAGALAVVGLGAMVLLPLLEAASRKVLGFTPVGSAEWVRHLTLWVGMVGGVLASVEGRHFSMALGEAMGGRRARAVLSALSRGGAVGVLVFMTMGAWTLMDSLHGFPSGIGSWFPVSAAMAPMLVGMGLMGVVTLVRPGEGWGVRLGTAGVAVVAVAVAPPILEVAGPWPVVAGLGGVVALALAGMPIYAALGGAALLLFFRAEVGSSAVLDATYQIVTKPVLPSVPLFALAGVVLARGGAPKRLIRLVRAWMGWMPGGASVATILACAFFTAITGASGVTILALGGLLFPVLLAARHDEPFSLGLVTASGSVGLLFPPSVPVILCAVYGRVGLDMLFLAAFLPGVLLLGMLGAFSLARSPGNGGGRSSFTLREALGATREAWGDLLLPVLIVAAFFGGLMAPVETAALAALWAVALEVGIHRSMKPGRELARALVETSVLVGALVVVIGFAQGLFLALVDAQIPTRGAEWIPTVIESKWMFLLVLNLVLLLVGAFMDIYSAIVVVVPLLLPLAAAYGIHPAHLAVVFLTNMELGYLTPPVGMNLFLSSLTFRRRLLEVWRAALPFFTIFVLWVLLVTYLPWISAGFAEWVLR